MNDRIFPSILETDLYQTENLLEIFQSHQVNWLHIDVMDGHFVPNFGFNTFYVQQLKAKTDFLLDCHLMVDEPEKWVRVFAAAGADMISIHVESTLHINAALSLIRSCGSRVSVAINPGTSILSLEPVLSMVDNVLVMTTNPGRKEKGPILETLNKIRWLKKQKRIGDDFTYTVQVDGAMNDETIRKFAEAGADTFVSGSYLVKSTQSAASNLNRLQEIIGGVKNERLL